MWTFNTLLRQDNQVNYCSHKWGLRLKRRLAKIEIWAEKQGLELAADCHLARITQTAHLLQARKGTAEDIATLSSTCFKLNSLQLARLLSAYQPAESEAPISNQLIDTIVRVAENTVDELTRAEGREVSGWRRTLFFNYPSFFQRITTAAILCEECRAVSLSSFNPYRMQVYA